MTRGRNRPKERPDISPSLVDETIPREVQMVPGVNSEG